MTLGLHTQTSISLQWVPNYLSGDVYIMAKIITHSTLSLIVPRLISSSTQTESFTVTTVYVSTVGNMMNWILGFYPFTVFIFSHYVWNYIIQFAVNYSTTVYPNMFTPSDHTNKKGNIQTLPNLGQKLISYLSVSLPTVNC